MLTPSPRLSDLTVYKPRKERRDATLRLDSNEGRGPELLCRYPNASELEATLAARVGVTSTRMLVTAGADDALDRICRAVLCRGRNIVLPSPTFEMLPRYAKLADGEVRNVPWLRQPFPTDDVLAAADERTAAVAVVSPNNPTGSVATADDLTRLRRDLPDSALLVVDLAYGELADDDLGAIAQTLPNTVVTRTLSKAWSLAGLRVGYVTGPERVIGWLRRVGNPYAVAAPSLALAQMALDDEADMRDYVARIRQERADLFEVLRELGAAPLSSQANFVLCEPPSARGLVDGLAERGIAVRTWPDDPQLCNFVRIGCPGAASDMKRLTDALGEVLS